MRHAHAVLGAEPRSVGAARRMLRELLADAGAEQWLDEVQVAASEVVTNALVHAGSGIELQAWASPDAVRVEVVDANPQLPLRRDYAATAGTGRGLLIVTEHVDRWGSERRPGGKTVWFELGRSTAGSAAPAQAATSSSTPPSVDTDTVTVRLRQVPLLMHWAWQEHAQALLREYLLFALDSDPQVLDKHAQASDALRVLHNQVPVPQLPDDPDALLADAIDPGVSAEAIDLEVPRAALPHFATLEATLGRATDAAVAGLFLGPPTQPEIGEMRQWLCEEIARQATTGSEPRAWHARTGVREPLADQRSLRTRYADLLEVEGESTDVLVTNEASIIVAVSPRIVRFLGYRADSDLLGRRVIAVVPPRYHQAHIAGTTLNATNGRDVLLGVPVTVPLVRADDSEVTVELRVVARRLDDERRVFVAHIGLPDAAA